MKLRHVAIVLVIGVVAAVCVRLGFWQLSRLAEKRTENARREAALLATPREIGSALLTADEAPALRLIVRGAYDESHQVLLGPRVHNGSPGVHVMTPLRFADGAGAVLVDRGWIYAGDAATASPAAYAEPGTLTVMGVVGKVPRGEAGFPWRRIDRDGIALWSARRLDVDSLNARFPYTIAPWVIHQLPGEGVPAEPVRTSPEPLDDLMHLSYAIQWFLFATILVLGSVLVALRRNRQGGPPGPVAPEG